MVTHLNEASVRLVNGIDIGAVQCASGARNFFGEGYSVKGLVPGGCSWKRSVLVTKTTTVDVRVGNMTLVGDSKPRGWFLMKYLPLIPALYGATQPVDWFPDCIWWNFESDVVNSVGLSGPGAEALFLDGRWQAHLAMGKVLIVSFVSTLATPEERQVERAEFIRFFVELIPLKYWSLVVLQENASYPNTSRDVGDTADLPAEMEASSMFVAEMTDGKLGYMVKVSATIDPAIAAKVGELPHVHGICVSNTFPWGHVFNWPSSNLPVPQVYWRSIRGEEQSPLFEADEKYGNGGLSGPRLRPVVREWVRLFRALNNTTHLNVGGGIFKFKHAKEYIDLGADSVFLGSVGMLRPWRVQSIIDRVNGYTCSSQVRYRDIARQALSTGKNGLIGLLM